MEKLNKVDSSAFVRSERDTIQILDGIDWDFTSKSFVYEKMKPFDCRKHHWFPATFIPEIPYTLIETLTNPGATVYDPFAGIGTTYFQALLLGRRPLATEICSVAVEFMKALQSLLDPTIDLDNVRKTLEDDLEKYSPAVDYAEKAHENIHVKAIFDELEKWYHRSTLNQIAYLVSTEADCPNPAEKATIRISLSAILKRASSQNRGWGCIADNVTPKPAQIENKDAIRMFRIKVHRLLTDISDHLRFVGSEYSRLYRETVTSETIMHADAKKRDNLPDGSVDLIVTSPPYPNMTDYVKSQRLSYYWLGKPLSKASEPMQDLACEIGARRKRGQSKSLQHYLDDLRTVNEALSKKVREGGYVCFVMPLFGSVNQNDVDRRRIVQRAMSDLERYFIKERELERTIPAIKRTHNIKWSTLDRERIYVFRKGGGD